MPTGEWHERTGGISGRNMPADTMSGRVGWAGGRGGHKQCSTIFFSKLFPMFYVRWMSSPCGRRRSTALAQSMQILVCLRNSEATNTHLVAHVGRASFNWSTNRFQVHMRRSVNMELVNRSSSFMCDTFAPCWECGRRVYKFLDLLNLLQEWQPLAALKAKAYPKQWSSFTQASRIACCVQAFLLMEPIMEA